MAVKQNNNDENKKNSNQNNVSQVPNEESNSQQNSEEKVNTTPMSSKNHNDDTEGQILEADEQNLQSQKRQLLEASITTINDLTTIKNILFLLSRNNSPEQSFISKLMLKQISKIKYPKHAEEIKSFKEDIQEIMQIYETISEVNNEFSYIHYLRQVFSIIASAAPGEVSCAITIIFQLFPDNKIMYALQRAFQTFGDEHDDEAIKKTVKILCEWIRICTFCTNLHIWVLSIIKGLYEKQKYALLYEIFNENIEQLFISLIIPHCREKVFSVIYEILTSVKDDPALFHKIVRRVPSIIKQLRKECEENKNKNPSNDIVKTKRVLANLIDLMINLIELYPLNNGLYSDLEIKLNECTTSNFRLFLNTIYDEEILRNKKVGLVNLGNTCYMNSVLQALGLTKEFARDILLNDCKTQLFSNLQILLAKIYYSNRVVIAPTDLFEAARPSYFGIGVQHDSSEFLLHLLENLHEQEDQYKKKLKEDNNDRKLIELNWVQGLPDINNTNNENMNVSILEPVVLKLPASPSRLQEYAEQQAANSKTVIDKIFTGKLLVNFKCLVCNTVSTNNDNLRCFQLSHPDNELKHSVQELLDYYCSTEKLEGDNQYYCEKCKCYNNAEILKKVNSAPKNAILVFKQFTYDKRTHIKGKLMHKIYNNEEITIQVHKDNTVSSVKYTLYAGVIHAGYSVDSGHYYTFGTDLTKDNDNFMNWYTYNDQVVQKFNFQDLENLNKSNTPYILFYRQTDNAIESIPNFNSIPNYLQELIEQDKHLFYEELKRADLQRLNNFYNDNNLRKNSNNDDKDKPPPTGGCGENALNVNVNNFIC